MQHALTAQYLSTPRLEMLFLFLASSIIFALFLFNRRQFRYWTLLKIPQGDNQEFLIGDVRSLALRQKSVADYFTDLYERTKKNHKIFGIYFTYRPILIVNDHEIAKAILTKDFHCFENRGILDDEEIDLLTGNLFCLSDDKWKNLRQKVTPLFSSSKLKLMMPIILDCTKTLSDFVDGNYQKMDFDARQLSARFTMTLISSIAFGIDNDSINKPENAFNQMSLKVSSENSGNLEHFERKNGKI